MHDIEKLLSDLRSDNLDARLKAVIMLGRAGDARAVEPLIALLHDSSMSIREAAAHALGEIRDVRAIGPLCSILSAYSDGHAAAVALVKIGAPAVEQVAAVLAGKPDIIKARETAAEVLGLIGDIRAIDPLIAALSFPIGLVGQPARAALVRIGEPSVAALAAALRNKQLNAAPVLFEIGTPAAMEALKNALSDEKQEVRQCVAEVLGLVERRPIFEQGLKPGRLP
jgi:HEAT repeat protein